MNNTIKLKYVSLDELILDNENPRFGKLYNGGKSESDLIEYLLFNEAAEEVANAIYKAQKFYEDKALWVLEKDGKYIVKDGNRRCASLKALSKPGKYGLKFSKFTLKSIPVYVYKDEDELNKRISEEHAGNLFRKWERIAKAIEIYRLHKLNDEDSVKSLDSKPGDLIKLASFYEEAFKIAGDDLNLLLRRGKGKAGGKTIIFERMFKYKRLCGYDFKNAPNYSFKLISNKRFEHYIKSIVELLKQKGDEITTDTIDKNFSEFKKSLKEFGFNIDDSYLEDDISSNNTSANGASANGASANGASANGASSNGASSNGASSNGASSNGASSNGASSNGASANGASANGASANGASANGASANGASANGASANGASANGASANGASANGASANRGTIKKRPSHKRKGLHPGIKVRIDEYFNLPSTLYPNAKIAMSRVLFEIILKYVVEYTKFNGKTTMNKTGYFQPVYRNKYTDATLMKIKFTDLITSTVDKKHFQDFDLEKMHQVIHNYKTGGLVTDSENYNNSLIFLIEFMLQDEQELLNSLDITKL